MFTTVYDQGIIFSCLILEYHPIAVSNRSVVWVWNFLILCPYFVVAPPAYWSYSHGTFSCINIVVTSCAITTQLCRSSHFSLYCCDSEWTKSYSTILFCFNLHFQSRLAFSLLQLASSFILHFFLTADSCLVL